MEKEERTTEQDEEIRLLNTKLIELQTENGLLRKIVECNTDIKLMPEFKIK